MTTRTFRALLTAALPALLPAVGHAGTDPDALFERARHDGVPLAEISGRDGLSAWVGDAGQPAMPRLQHGDAPSGLHGQWTWRDEPGGWRVRLGATLQRPEAGSALPVATLEGSELSLPLGAGRLYLSQQRRHWGPGWVGSLILDGRAPPLAAAGWRKADEQPFHTPWLRWLGPWQADVFMGSLGAHEQPRRPWLIGMRLAVQPLEGLTIGLSRTLQWGGRGRDQSLTSFWHALTGRDNVGDRGIDAANEPGNQMAGYDLHYHHAGDGAFSDWSAYLQGVGEDEAGGLPSKLLWLAGADTGGRLGLGDDAGADAGRWRAFVEWADTGMRHAFGTLQPGAYRHPAFARGYTQYGVNLGHPIGGDATLVSVGGLLGSRNAQLVAMFHRGRALQGSQYFTPGERLWGASLALSAPDSAAWRWGASLNALRHGGRNERSAQAWLGTGW